MTRLLRRVALRALVALAAALFVAQPAAAVAVSTAAAAAVQVAAPSTTRATHVRAYQLVAAGTTTVQLEYGTQTTNPCDTGAVVLTGAMSLVAQGKLEMGDGLGDLFVVPVGEQLCVLQTGAVQLSGFVTFVQF